MNSGRSAIQPGNRCIHLLAKVVPHLALQLGAVARTGQVGVSVVITAVPFKHDLDRVGGLCEYGEEETGRRAIDINADDPWAVHAVAHVMEMQGRHGEGAEWITGLQPHWDQANNFRYHLWWHRALMHLGRGEADEALRLYDESMWDPDSDEYLDLCNDVSLLLRLELMGVDVGDRWRVLAEKASSRINDRMLAFIDCHVVAALAAAGQTDKAEWMVGDMASAGGVFADVGATVSKALIAHRAGDYPAAARLLGEVRDDIVTIGGSHAQRNLFNLLLEDAGDR